MPRRTTAALLATLGVIGIAAHTFAQAPKPVQSPTPAPQPTEVNVQPDGRVLQRSPGGQWIEQVIDRPTDVLGLADRVSINFPGGTVEEYVEAVRTAAAPKAVNILVPTEINDIRLPAIRLQSVTLWAAWSALEPAIRAQPAGIEVQIEALGGRIGSAVSSEAVQIAVDRRRNMGATFPSDTLAVENVEIISIADLVEPRPNGGVAVMKVEDVLAAVESAARIAADSGSSLPSLKFHPPTGVLISRGSMSANNLVKEVVSTIRQNSVSRAEQLDRSKLAKDVFEQRIAQAKAQLDAAESNVEMAQRRLAQQQQLFEKGSIPKEELDGARDGYEGAMRDLNRQKQQLTLIQSTGVESVQTELAVNMQRTNLSDRVAQLEREVEALKTLLNMSGRSGGATPPPGRAR